MDNIRKRAVVSKVELAILNEEVHFILYFLCGEALFLGGSIAFGGLGLNAFGADGFATLLRATNLFGFAGTMFLVTR